MPARTGDMRLLDTGLRRSSKSRNMALQRELTLAVSFKPSSPVSRLPQLPIL